jgi:hypothetical protein
VGGGARPADDDMRDVNANGALDTTEGSIMTARAKRLYVATITSGWLVALVVAGQAGINPIKWVK